MDYNSQREKLILPEYGRNIQEMIQYATSIEDREERNKAARTIVSVMAATNPNYKDIEDFNHKLWDHLFIISGYQLDADSPFPLPMPSEKTIPAKLKYPQKSIKYRHYGKNIEYFIEKALKAEDQEIRDKFTEVLANMMKKSYLNWNRDSVNDELIKHHLVEMSEGELAFKESHRMTSTSDILGLNKKNPASQQNPKQGFQKKGFHQGGKKFKKNFQKNNMSKSGPTDINRPKPNQPKTEPS
jgi:hypothetical protein